MILSAAAISLLVASGCASKKYVRETVAPVQQRVDELDTKTTENRDEIAKLDERVDKDISRLDERTESALQDAAKAQESADKAQGSADTASGQANDARTFAGAGLTRLEQTMVDMTRFEPRGTEAILFGFDKSALTPEAKEQLSSLIAQAGSRSRYIVEVRGFTDTTGAADYNLRLSQRRADAVVRELNSSLNVPLRAIHQIGLGQDAPMADNKTKDGRKQNRRVEVTLYVPRAEAGSQVSRN
ncbi:MAG: OmpA family protein [Acidobacteria bacterium]|nr:OmpA family protein [Acidobacteriota bacterium]